LKTKWCWTMFLCLSKIVPSAVDSSGFGFVASALESLPASVWMEWQVKQVERQKEERENRSLASAHLSFCQSAEFSRNEIKLGVWVNSTEFPGVKIELNSFSKFH
jgi:hypothetical protein